jgi:hypothetical protein
VHREFMRNDLRDLTAIVHTTACRQMNYVETYSRYILFPGYVPIPA